MDSIVWGMTPSSADTTRTMMSVTMAPLSRRAVKAAWPGVSRKVMSSPDDVFTAEKKTNLCHIYQGYSFTKRFSSKVCCRSLQTEIQYFNPLPPLKKYLTTKAYLKNTSRKINEAWKGIKPYQQAIIYMYINSCPSSFIQIIKYDYNLPVKAPMCWVIPPNSSNTTLDLRSASRSVVFPWSMWPMIVMTGGRGTNSLGLWGGLEFKKRSSYHSYYM